MTELPIGRTHWLPLHRHWHRLIESRGELFYVWPGQGAEKLSASDAEQWRTVLNDYNDNRLAYFLPHGDGLDFINDWTNEIVMLVAPTRTGKSAHGCAWTLLRGIRCDPAWHCFTQHRVKYMEWRGPRKLVISSYSWSNVAELWEEYRKWCPRKLLGRYAVDWGRNEDEKGAGKTLSFGTGRPQAAKLEDGTELVFLCDGQALGAWEGKRWDDAHFDEQRERDKWISYLRGTSNTPGKVQACMTLSGYVLPERPDTGAGGWVKRELWDGAYTYGRNVGRYQLSMATVPEAVLSKEEKDRLYKQWVTEPAANQDEVMLRKGQARYHGGWESGAGLVIDNFMPQHHVIPDYDRKHPVVQKATKYRGVDHALGGPCAACCVEVFPWGDVVMYREYYQKGKLVQENARGIVEACGNRLVTDSEGQTDDVALPNKLYIEVPQNEDFFMTVLDSRSFSSPADSRKANIGELYRDAGLDCRPASGQMGDKLIPNMLSYLRLQHDRPHIMWQFWKRGIVSDEKYKAWLNDRQGDWKNGAMLYFVASLHWAFIEINSWAWSESVKTGKRVPKKENDHLIGSALKYALAEKPAYWGVVLEKEAEGRDDERWHEEYSQRGGFKYV